MKPKTYPLQVTVDHSFATIYANTIGDATRYRIVYREKGERKCVTVSDPAEAEREAKDILKKLNEAEPKTLSAAEHADYLAAMEHLQPFNPRVSLAEAARYYAQTHKGTNAGKRVADVADEFLATLSNPKRKLNKRYVQQVKGILKATKKQFDTDIARVTYPQLQTFLEDACQAAKTHNHYVTTLKAMFNYARNQEYLPRDFDAADKLQPLRVTDGEIGVWSREEIFRLFVGCLAKVENEEAGMTDCRRAFLPCMAIGAFAGLRAQEICRLDWNDIKFDDQIIMVRAIADGERNKTGKRTVPLLPNLAQWLKEFAQKSGRVWPYSYAQYCCHVQSAVVNATAVDGEPAIEWRRNGLRHSFISYRIQLVGNRFDVAEEAGNSPEIIKRHYMEVELPNGRIITKQESIKWFSICPDAKLAPVIREVPKLLPVLAAVGE